MLHICWTGINISFGWLPSDVIHQTTWSRSPSREAYNYLLVKKFSALYRTWMLITLFKRASHSWYELTITWIKEAGVSNSCSLLISNRGIFLFQASTDFWSGRNQWLPTWNGDDVAMQVDYVKVWALWSCSLLKQWTIRQKLVLFWENFHS
jgi:hypothetical protein